MKKNFDKLVMAVFMAIGFVFILWLTITNPGNLFGSTEVEGFPLWLFATLGWIVIAIPIVHQAYDINKVNKWFRGAWDMVRILVFGSLGIWWYIGMIAQLAVSIETDPLIAFTYAQFSGVLAGFIFLSKGVKTAHNWELPAIKTSLLLSTIVFFFLASVGWTVSAILNSVPWLGYLSIIVYLLGPLGLMLGTYLLVKSALMELFNALLN